MITLMIILVGVLPTQAQYVEAHKIDTLSKGLPEPMVLDVLSTHLGVPSATLKQQQSSTGLPLGQVYIANAMAKASKSDVNQLFAENKTKAWGEIAKAKNIKMKSLSDDLDKVEKDLKDLSKSK
jgi:hypothetical protein